MKKISFEEAIKALKEGKKVYTDIKNEYVKLFDNLPCLFDVKTNNMLEYSICVSSFRSKYLPEEPKPFEITETGLYKTRDGKKAFVFFIGGRSIYCVDYVIMGESGHFACTPTGDTCMDKDKHFDIIGKWGDDE